MYLLQMVVNTVGKQLNTFLELRALVTAYFLLVLLSTFKIVALFTSLLSIFLLFLEIIFSMCELLPA